MVRMASAFDVNAVASLASFMWCAHSLTELSASFSSIISSENAMVWVCEQDEKIVGFAQCGLRFDYVEGTKSSPVGYLEGIYVAQEYRHRGIAKKLTEACCQWAITRGCKEFASDCEISNEESIRFHQRCGFIEANRIVCFTKKL